MSLRPVLRGPRSLVLAQEVCINVDHGCSSHRRYEPIVEPGVNVVTSP